MKTLIVFFLLSLQLHASNERPYGFFQIDPMQSSVRLFDKNQKINGIIHLEQELSNSKMKIESSESSFESLEFNSDLNHLEIKGHLTYQGKSRPITLKGRYLGMISDDLGQQKVALLLNHEALVIKIFATRPTDSTAAIHKEVQEIIQ